MKILTLDAGHGGKDPGALGKTVKEKDVVLDIVLKVGKALTDKYDIKVTYSRTDDRFLSLATRVIQANIQRSDYFISFHNNAFNTVAEGYESFIHAVPSKKTIEMQDKFHKKVVESMKAKGLKFKDRGKKRAKYTVLTTVCPAMLVEIFFIDNEKEEKILKEKRKEIIDAHVEAIAYALELKPKNEKTEEKRKEKTHIVEKGQTLWAISKIYGVTVTNIKAWNNLKTDIIQPNQKLIIKG